MTSYLSTLYFGTLKRRMIPAKTYKTVTKFVKLCLEYCGLFFPGHDVSTRDIAICN